MHAAFFSQLLVNSLVSTKHLNVVHIILSTDADQIVLLIKIFSLSLSTEKPNRLMISTIQRCRTGTVTMKMKFGKCAATANACVFEETLSIFTALDNSCQSIQGNKQFNYKWRIVALNRSASAISPKQAKAVVEGWRRKFCVSVKITYCFQILTLFYDVLLHCLLTTTKLD